MCPSPSDKEQPALTKDSPFKFSCNDSLLCFTQCCRDVNIYLTPYDILRLRRSLRISSAEFLEEYTHQFVTRVSNVPVVLLKMTPDTLYCQLVTEIGCGVYENRPWACRMYPLDVDTKEGEYRPIVGKDRCFGFLEPAALSVGEWLAGQGLQPYVEMERIMQAAMPERFSPEAPMKEGLGRLLFLAYDLDSFSALLDDPSFRTNFEVDDEKVRLARENDEELLKLAYRYIRSQMEELY